MFQETWHSSWNEFLTPEVIQELEKIEEKIKGQTFYPEKENILRFLNSDLNKIRYIIMGMEPYPSYDYVNDCPQATGRSFEVSEIIDKDWNYKIKQSSLRNILKAIYFNETGNEKSLQEIRFAIDDGLFNIANPGEWFDKMEKQGVLFLNSTLTVEANNVGSHKKIWDDFRKMLITYLAEKNIKWMLWGNNAKNEVGQFLKPEQILEAPHPRLDSFITRNTFQHAKDIDWTGVK